MKMTNEEYAALVQRHSRPSPTGKNLVWAFLTGGSICAVGQLLQHFYRGWGLDREGAGLAASVTLIGVTALLTALGVFDKLAKHAGAGTLVPITGFANAMVSPAIEFKTEGFITGMGARMFNVAGPVLAFGITASVVYGVVLWLTTR